MIAADQIHPPPDRQDDTEKSSTKKSGEVPSKHSPSDEAFSKTELSNKNIQNNESSVKPTNQKVHPTVSRTCFQHSLCLQAVIYFLK